MKPIRYIAALLLSLGLLAPAVQAAEQAPWYDIELILFKQGGAGTADTENWPEDPGSPDWSGAVSLQPAVTDDPRQPYTLLPAHSRQLGAQFEALQRTRGELEPLLHQAWRQPVAASDGAEPIYLGPESSHRSELPPPPFEGLISISVNRYLHVNLDILLRGANRELPLAAPDALSTPTRGSIRFQASRRMRSGELHYIDHPRLGALILISRVELPEQAAELPAEPPAAPAATESAAPPPASAPPENPQQATEAVPPAN